MIKDFKLVVKKQVFTILKKEKLLNVKSNNYRFLFDCYYWQNNYQKNTNGRGVYINIMRVSAIILFQKDIHRETKINV